MLRAAPCTWLLLLLLLLLLPLPAHWLLMLVVWSVAAHRPVWAGGCR